MHGMSRRAVPVRSSKTVPLITLPSRTRSGLWRSWGWIECRIARHRIVQNVPIPNPHKCLKQRETRAQEEKMP